MSKSQKTAVIMAGGFGTRLRKAGFAEPKPMVPILGKPVLEYQINLCKLHDFDQIYLITFFQTEIIEKYFGDGSAWGVQINYLVESSPNGTAGALAEFIEILPEQFLLLYGDTFLDVDLRRMMHFHLTKKPTSTIMVHPNNHPSDSDLVEVDEETQLVRRLLPYPHSDKIPYRNCVNAALYCFDRIKIERYLTQGLIQDIAKDIFPKIIASGEEILSYKTFEYIKDMGTPDRLAKVQADIQKNIPKNMNFSQNRQAVFLDRDGTINTERGLITQPEQLELIDDAALSIKRLNEAGYLVICITNQPGIARGDITKSQLNLIHAKLDAELGFKGAYLDDLLYCPHHPDKGYPGEVTNLKVKCSCRKPEPGLILRAMKKYRLSKASFFVGDATTDIAAAQKVGIKSILLSTGHGGRDGRVDVIPDFMCKTFTEAVDLILQK